MLSNNERTCRLLQSAMVWLGVLATSGTVYVQAQDCEINDDEETVAVNNGGLEIRVYFDDGNCDFESMCDHDNDLTTPNIPCTLDWAQSFAETLMSGVSAALDEYRALGFPEPWQEDIDDEYKIVADPTDLSGAHAAAECTTYGTNMTNNNGMACLTDGVFMRMVGQHELFHHIQRRYALDLSDGDLSGLGDWAVEGTARYLQDKLFTDLDASSYSFAGFVSEVNAALAVPETSLLDLSYKACLFWNYCGEQFGGSAPEPALGSNFVQNFWVEVYDNGGTGDNYTLNSLEETITYNGGGSLNEVWRDYAIANYAKDLDMSGFADGSKYTYVDENQFLEGTWISVPRDQVTVPTIGPIEKTLAPYSAYYVEGSGDLNYCDVIGFRGESPVPVGWAALALSWDNQVLAFSKGIGTDIGRGFINHSADLSISKIAVILAGLDQVDIAQSTSIWLDYGPPTVVIDTPYKAHPAFIRVEDTYRPFNAYVIVDGPEDLKPDGAGDRSVLGLLPEDFTVQVEGIDSEIISARYLGQYYVLTVAAPPSLPIGQYDLTVRLCGGGSVDTNTNAIVIDDVVRNHVLVMDQSGSMADPEGDSKLDAAKIAASLIVDATSSLNRIGLISFNGNNVDCDDDAVIQQWLLFADDNQKSDIIEDLDLLVANGWTSIGDGLWRAQDQLDNNSTVKDAYHITLLSDGMENEARRWETFDGCDSAAGVIVGTPTVIDTIAFGPQSDQTMMSDVADETGGLMLPVDVTAAGMRGSGPLSMANELAEAYIESFRSIHDLERVFVQAGELPGWGATIEIPIIEEKLEDVLFYFNTSDFGDDLSVVLRDPNGLVVSGAVATTYVADTHVVYRFHSSPMVGTWSADLAPQDDTDYVAGVLGRNPRLPKMEVDIAGIPQGSDFTVLCGYEQGVPVTIMATLYDDQGPILGADVTAEIIRPYGLTGCTPYRLNDDGSHNDGQPNDGVYGVVYTETGIGSSGGVMNDPAGSPVYGYVGSYSVAITATGIGHYGSSFDRFANSGFHVCESTDSDGDGLPDTWEAYYGLDPLAYDDYGLDSDDDLLLDFNELEYGTDPFDADTDGDGEIDGSEVYHGRGPTCPDDLAIRAPIDVEVMKDGSDAREPLPTSGLTLRFPWHNTYSKLHIERAAGLSTPLDFKPLATIQPALGELPTNYLDTDVEVNETYSYRFRAETFDGGLSRYSRVVSGTYFPDCNGNGIADPDDFMPVNETFDTNPGWVEDGMAGWSSPFKALILTLTGTSQLNKVALATPQLPITTSHFQAEFDFVMYSVFGTTPDDSGDISPEGFVFYVTAAEDAPDEAGENGCGMGYEDLPDASFAVEFDAAHQAFCGDQNGNHVGIDVGGSTQSIAQTFVPTEFVQTEDDIWHVRIVFESPLVTAWLTPPGGAEYEAVSGEIPSANLPGDSLVFGFTAANGANAVKSRVDNVVFTVLDMDCNANGVPDECDLSSGTSDDANNNDVPDECETLPCDGDPNGDGSNDPLDAGYVQARFGCTVGAGDSGCDSADANGDGFVDPLDLGYVIARFGDCGS